MRPGSGRPGQVCFLSLLGEINKRVEALFLTDNEDGTSATLFIGFAEVEHLDREPCVISNQQGEEQPFFIVTAPFASIYADKTPQ